MIPGNTYPFSFAHVAVLLMSCMCFQEQEDVLRDLETQARARNTGEADCIPPTHDKQD